MKKLLNKTLSAYAIFAVILLVLTAPAFYLISQKLYYDDVDEAIMLRKKEFLNNTLSTLKQNEISTWNRFNRDTQIQRDTIGQPKDQIVQRIFFDSLANENEPYRVLFTNVNIQNTQYTLMIRSNLVESEDLMITLALLYCIILIILLLGFVIVSRVVSNKLWKPFYHTLNLVKQFNLQDYTLPKFSTTSTKEFSQLNNSLQKLIEENIKTFQIQKEFTENAAHELQTPLAIFQTKLDLLLQTSGLTNEQALILQQLYDAASRLSRVNKNLLLLAKIENHQFQEKENLNISDMVKDAIPYFSEQAQEKQLNIQSDITSSIITSANKGLAEILINNFLLNSIRHNISGGQLSINVKDNMLVISNTGVDKALDPQSLFIRFSQTSQSSHGSGLGLAIIKKIADLNKWAVSYSYVNSLHIFSVKF